jgi:hypothetical protein
MSKRRLPRAVDLPALAAFARGYLHEDAIVEYGSGPDAATAFGKDASPEEWRRLVDDLERLAAALDGRATGRVARFFTHELRAAWAPETVAELRELIARLLSVETP